ncbi:MAG: glycoside hydrolase family 3 C-terminal domain-containing protein [Lachnospiraceae bacterium]|nr:glycoside hydrolase family 3 C-terminal domain-containing protein [Lachnospiraceae bacterium]
MDKKKGRTAKRLFVIGLTLACVLTAVYAATSAYAALINNHFGISTSRIVENEPDSSYDSNYFPAVYDTPEKLFEAAAALCRQAEAEGLVLLTNKDGALPLPSGSKVSFFAQGSVYPNFSSTGSSASGTEKCVSFRNAFEGAGFTVNPGLWDWYAGKAAGLRVNTVDGLVKTYTVNELPWDDVRNAQQATFPSYGDAAIVVLSRDSGEGFDVSTRGSDGRDGSYLSMTPQEEALLKGLTELKGSGVFQRIVVLLNGAVPMQTDFLSDPGIGVDACLWVGNLGLNGTEGVADVLSGRVNPSGRLTDTYVKDSFSSPAMASWKLNDKGLFAQVYGNADGVGLNSSQKYYGVYTEGIYVGYRYYETRYEDVVTQRPGAGSFDYRSVVAFPFGHGLSYTTFEYSGFSVSHDAGKGIYSASVTVKNTGTAAGRETVQIYLQKPYADGGVEKASVELAGFGKTGLLEPGASEAVTVEIREEQFRSYDAEGAGTYVLDPGDYYLAAGTDAHDALNNILAKKGLTPENTAGRMTGGGSSALAEAVLHLDRKDDRTYAVSKETGAAIGNRLDFVDINRYPNRGENHVTYVSRSDWEGTWPAEPVRLTVSGDAMLADLSSHKAIPEDASAVSPVYNVQNGSQLIALRGLPYDHSAWDLLLDQLTYEEQALLVSNAAFGTSPLDSIALRESKASDGPTAVTASVTSVSFPSEGIWASSFDTELIRKIGAMIAEDARLNGVDTMYAPGINIHRTPFGGRAHEYFSEDPFLTGAAAAAEAAGMQEKGVVAVLKHFIFNDEEAARNGICVWLNEQSAREIYLAPFEYAMRPSLGAAKGAMSSFNRAGALWTGASGALQTDIARGEWGFEGYFITDMASSNGALFMTYDDGVINGTDLFLGSGSKTALKEWKNSIPYRIRVREAVHRVLYVMVNFSAMMNGISPTTRIVTVMPLWQVLLLGGVILSALAAAAGLVLSVAQALKEKKEEER